MAINNNGRDVALDALVAAIDFIGLHSGDPGSAGANELAGGSPAYARKAITWGAAGSGTVSKSGADIVFDVEGGDTVSFIGFWSLVTGGTCYGGADVTDEVFGAQGTYTLTDVDISAT
jgi:hypothetical protein